MRIMIVTDQYPPMVGGVPQVTYRLATGLARRGHLAAIVAPGDDPHTVHRLEEGVHLYRFPSFAWPTREEQRLAFLPILPVRRLVKQFDPAVLHVHSPLVLGNIAQILAGGLRKPVIATNHYLPSNISPALSSDPLLGKSFQSVSYAYLVHFCNRCQYVTAPTQAALGLLYAHGLRAPARVISNGIDLTRYRPGAPDDAVRQRFHLPADRPLVLAVNRLSQEKRLDVLLDAVARMREHTHLVLAGTGPAEAQLRAQVEALDLQERVTFPGYVSEEDLLALYRLAQVFAIPSEAELQSLSTMEAMACGLPVVAADAYALPELVRHEQNGLLFPPGRSDEMAGALDRLLRDERLRTRMGTKSLQLIASHDLRLVLDEWEALYQRLPQEFVDTRKRKRAARKARTIRRSSRLRRRANRRLRRAV